MQTQKAKRVEIIIEAVMEKRLTDALEGRCAADRAGRGPGAAPDRSAARAACPASSA